MSLLENKKIKRIQKDKILYFPKPTERYYLEKYEMVEGENQPIGLILCTGKNEEHIELMQLDKSNIKVAEYLTILPPTKLLQEKLHKAIEIAKNKLPNHKS